MLKKIMMLFLVLILQNSFAQSTLDNKTIATKFFEAIVNQKDFTKAEKYLGSYYTEHDPEGTDGAAGLKNYIEYLKLNYPNSHVSIKKVIVDGNYVLFHVHSILIPGTRGQAIVDIFRLEEGKVVEHWDVTQEIPETSANDNGMF